MQKETRQAQKALRHAVRNAPELRQTFLEERANAEAIAHNRDATKILKRIINAEASSRSFNTLRRVLGKTKTGALSSIMVPGDEPDTWDRIYDQNQITDTIIERNQTHFGQAKGTPFTVSPLENWVGYHGTSKSADAVLRGELPPDELKQCTEGAQAVLEALQQEIATPNSVDTRITVDDLQSGFKAWRETTSTIIEKIPGRPLLHKLRVIQLLEADLNLALGIIWSRRLMTQGEKLGAFGDEQWGSRNGRSANTVVLLKHLTYEMMQLTKTDGGTFDNDATACFDRIIPASQRAPATRTQNCC